MMRVRRCLGYFFMIFMCWFVPFIHTEAETVSGTYGENLTWVLENNTLIISGEGAMRDYVYGKAHESPWNKIKFDIQNVVIEEGVTSIGQLAFNNFYSLTHMEIPDGVTSIGINAFWEAGLKSIKIADSVTNIDAGAFSCCSNLKYIEIPGGVTNIASSAFVGGDSLSDVYYGGTKEQWEAIVISSGLKYLENVTIHYNSSMPSYEIKLYSNVPTMVVGTDQKVPSLLQLEKNGEIYEGNCDYSFVVSDKDILEITDISKEERGVVFNICGKKEGLTKVTVTELNTGAVFSTTVQVGRGILTYNAEALPIYYNRDLECNGYINGIFIDEFETKKKNDTEFTVSFNAYNSTSIVGAVDIYDANGKLIDSTPIKRFDGGLITGFGDTLWLGWKLVQDLTEGKLLTYKQNTCSQETKILLDVPIGGHIEITNDVNYSDSCMLFNVSELTATTLLLFSDSVTQVSDAKKIAEESSLKLFKQCAKEEVRRIADEFRKKVALETIKLCGENHLKSMLLDITEVGLYIYEVFDIDIVEIVKSCSYDVGIGIVEKSFIQSTSIYGDALNTMFTVNKYCDLACFFCGLGKECVDSALYIHFNDAEGCLSNGGVSIKAADGGMSLSENNFVMHSMILSNEADLDNVAKETLDNISSNYIVRNLYLERDGVVSQPGQEVLVYYPVPSGYKANDCVIYWVKDDGSLELIPTAVVGENLVFTTEHFSYYALVDKSNGSNPFDDIFANEYYYAPVLWAVKEGITDGYTATTFAPNMACTRGQVMTFLWRAAGQPKVTTTDNPFTDVTANAYYYDAVLWAVENGITDGWADTLFAPEMECTRGQIVTFLWRAAEQLNATIVANPFADVTENAYYYDAVLWAVENGITDGWTETQFAPEMKCTRGQIVTFLHRYYTKNNVTESVCGTWTIDAEKFLEINSESLRSAFGSSIKYGHEMKFMENGDFSYYIAAGIGGEGSYSQQGDQILTNITTYEEGNKEELVFQIMEEDGKTYIVTNDYGYQVYWYKQ